MLSQSGSTFHFLRIESADINGWHAWVNSWVAIIFNGRAGTVPLFKTLFINISYPMLVLTEVLCSACQTDSKNSVKYYQGTTTSRENAIRK
jgi:hypothetical protein